MALSADTQKRTMIALADRVAGNELGSAIDTNTAKVAGLETQGAYSVAARIVATSTSTTTDFAALAVGDKVLHIASTANAGGSATTLTTAATTFATAQATFATAQGTYATAEAAAATTLATASTALGTANTTLGTAAAAFTTASGTAGAAAETAINAVAAFGTAVATAIAACSTAVAAEATAVSTFATAASTFATAASTFATAVATAEAAGQAGVDFIACGTIGTLAKAAVVGDLYIAFRAYAPPAAVVRTDSF